MTATLHDADLGDGAAPQPELPSEYRLGDVVGIGGTASVYRATDRRSGAEVAVKILHSTSDSTTAVRFAGEVRMLQELRHPGLAEIVDAGVAGHHPFLVTRFVDGETLQAAIRRGVMSADATVELGARLASTLAYVHARGIVHRDVKPANIVLDREGRPFLTDFGVSRIIEATQMTATGAAVGTPAYMAPEQVRGSTVGPAADVYALGLVLLEALTGRREYPGGLVESAVARLHRRPQVPAEVPAPLGVLLREMTADDPGRRPTAGRVANRLTGLTDVGTGGPRRTRLGAWLLVAVMVLGGTVLGVVRPGDSSPEAGAAVSGAPAVAPEPAPPSAAQPPAVASPGSGVGQIGTLTRAAAELTTATGGDSAPTGAVPSRDPAGGDDTANHGDAAADDDTATGDSRKATEPHPAKKVKAKAKSEEKRGAE